MRSHTRAYAIPRGRSDGVPSLSASTSSKKREEPKLSGEEGAKQSNEMAPFAFQSISCIMGHWGQNSDSGLIKWDKLAISAFETKRGGEWLQLSPGQPCPGVSVRLCLSQQLWLRGGSHGQAVDSVPRMLAEVPTALIATRGSWRRDQDLTPPVGEEPQASSCGNTTLQLARPLPSLPCHTEHEDF